MTTEAVSAFFLVAAYAIIIERALAIFFDIPWLDQRMKLHDPGGYEGTVTLKGVIAAIASIGLCIAIGLNLPFILAHYESEITKHLQPEVVDGLVGEVLTGLIVAGGSQGAVKLFQDFLGLSKTRRDQVANLRSLQIAAKKAEAESEIAHANARSAKAHLARNGAVLRGAVGLGIPAVTSPTVMAAIEDSDVVRTAIEERLPDAENRAALNLVRSQWRGALANRVATLSNSV